MKNTQSGNSGIMPALAKVILVVTLLCSPSLQMKAQLQDENQEDDTTLYGIKAGINFAELLGEDAIPESDRKVGYSLGAFAAFKVNKELKIQAELIWSLQGEKAEDKGRYDISYLNAPIMLKWKHKRFYTELGPQLDAYVQEQCSDAATSTTLSTSQHE